jgi:hypothetical protein
MSTFFDPASLPASLRAGCNDAEDGVEQQQQAPMSPHRVASDRTIAEQAAGRPVKLMRNDTLCVDELGELTRDRDMHVFSASYDVYALPKRQ